MDPTPTPPTNPVNPMPITSPTGKALVNLPPWLTILCAALVPACGTVAAAADLPKGLTIACVALGASAAALLGLSAGLRSQAGAIVALAVTAALLHPFPGHAEGLTAGPSLPMLAVTPGDPHPVAFAPGAGLSVGGDLFPTTLVGRPMHWLSLGGDVFGSILASSAAYNLSVAVHAAVLELLTIGVGLKLLDSGGHGALEHFDGRTVFVLVGLDYGLLNAFIYGHAGEAPNQPCDGDHPCS